MWKFECNLEAAVHAMLFFCNKAKLEDKKLSFMQIAKLLYYADKTHLKKYGRPITGDTYIAMQHGPNPSTLYDYLKSVRSDPGQKNHYIEVELVSSHSPNPTPFIIPLVEPLMEIFSESDKEVLEEIYCQHGHKSASQLRNESHEEKAYKNADFEMSFEDFLDEGDQEMKSYIEESQADWNKVSHILK